jgi:hypothetical protein
MSVYFIANLLKIWIASPSQENSAHLYSKVYLQYPADKELSYSTTHKNRIGLIFLCRAVRHHVPHGTNSLHNCRTV